MTQVKGESKTSPDDSTNVRRLAALERYDILDTPNEAAFDRVANLIQLVFKVDTSIVSMVDGHRQWYKAVNGSPNSEVPIDETFCRYVMQSDEPLVVTDATQDDRFNTNPHVTGPAHVRFYAGVPLLTPDGVNIGTLCAIDTKPRQFTTHDTEVLQGLANVVMNELELRMLATSDGLTGLLTRRAFKEDGRKLVAHARRYNTRLSALTFDIDHFKKINDTYGHPMGDQVLVAVAKAAATQLRTSDLIGRLGGEEFAVLLPENDVAAAQIVADKLMNTFRALRFPGSQPPINMTASFGIATLDPHTDDLDSLLEKSDAALYDAKRSGRDRYSVWLGPPSPAQQQTDRRRVLKAGSLRFRNRSITCTVRSIWDNGAELDVSSTAGIPDQELSLGIRSDHVEWPCRIINRQPSRLEVEFV